MPGQTKPYIEKYNATLNTVPVVGLKDNQIMYIDTSVSKTPSGLSDAWALFSSLPTDAKVSDLTQVHFFPFNGDFYLAVGTAVWKKAHRSDRDPQLSSAVDHWPKMFVDEWTKIGDACLPAPDLKSIVPFAILSADKNAIAFKVVLLGQDDTIQVLASDSFGATNTFVQLNYLKGQGSDSPTVAPKWTRMAYWNNQITALDDGDNTWDLTPDFTAQTYTTDTKIHVDHFTEFTATDVGPVGAAPDGYLYKRIVEPPPTNKEDQDPTLKWTRWILQDGVTNIGVASPGVLLDLHLLTSTLRSRYLDTQAAVYPAVSKILAFANTNKVFLGQLKAQADIYNSTSSTDGQKAQALHAGKEICIHAQVWAGILSRSVGGSTVAVSIMTKQLNDVKNQLLIQTQLLRDRLASLQAQLSSQKEALSKLQAAFWGAVACMFLG